MGSLGGSIKPWEKPWWNGSQNVNLSDFEYSQKGGSILGFVGEFTLVQNVQKCLEKMPYWALRNRKDFAFSLFCFHAIPNYFT